MLCNPQPSASAGSEQTPTFPFYPSFYLGLVLQKKGSRSASWRGYRCAQGLGPSSKIFLSPQPRIHVLHRLANTKRNWLVTARSVGRRRRGMERIARYSYRSKPTQPTHGGEAPHSSPYKHNTSQNSTKKKTTYISVSRLGGGSKGSRTPDPLLVRQML